MVKGFLQRERKKKKKREKDKSFAYRESMTPKPMLDFERETETYRPAQRMVESWIGMIRRELFDPGFKFGLKGLSQSKVIH